jgi:transcription initiation factor TFIIA small subunit
MKILSQFDLSVSEALHSQVRSKVSIKGHLHLYRNCDDVWTFIIEKPQFKFETETVVTEGNVKMVACAAK